MPEQLLQAELLRESGDVASATADLDGRATDDHANVRRRLTASGEAERDRRAKSSGGEQRADERKPPVEAVEAVGLVVSVASAHGLDSVDVPARWAYRLGRTLRLLGVAGGPLEVVPPMDCRKGGRGPVTAIGSSESRSAR